MEEESKPQEATQSFYSNIKWDIISQNKIDEQTFNKLKARFGKLYGTFLGSEGSYAFYMFKSLKWSEFKDIRAKKLDKDLTHDYILNNAVVWPKMDPMSLSELDAGIALTLVYQVLTMSNFISDPTKALDLVLEI